MTIGILLVSKQLSAFHKNTNAKQCHGHSCIFSWIQFTYIKCANVYFFAWIILDFTDIFITLSSPHVFFHIFSISSRSTSASSEAKCSLSLSLNSSHQVKTCSCPYLHWMKWFLILRWHFYFYLFNLDLSWATFSSETLSFWEPFIVPDMSNLIHKFAALLSNIRTNKCSENLKILLKLIYRMYVKSPF